MNETREPYHDSGNPYESPPLHEEEKSYNKKRIRICLIVAALLCVTSLFLIAFVVIPGFYVYRSLDEFTRAVLAYLFFWFAPNLCAAKLLTDSMGFRPLSAYLTFLLVTAFPPALLLLCLHATWILKYGNDIAAVPD